MRDDSAPDVETEPISSWLNRAIQFTLPSSTLKEAEDANVEIASTAANLSLVSVCNGGAEGENIHEENWLSMRGLNTNSSFKPPRTEG